MCNTNPAIKRKKVDFKLAKHDEVKENNLKSLEVSVPKPRFTVLISCVFYSLILLKLFTSTAVYANTAQLGSRNNPLRFAIVPSGHAATAMVQAKPVITCVEKDTGYFITLQIPNSYIAVSEAMGSNKLDLAFGDISTFLIARKKYHVEPFLQVIRYGVNYYQSMIIVRADSKIKSIKDLDGKKFAYPDASSASGYLLPLIEMKKNGLKFGQEVPTGSMDASVTAVLQKKVDAASAYYNVADPKTHVLRDARERLIGIYPDIAEKTRVIWTSQPIPNEPIFIRAGLSPEVKAKLAVSIPKCIQEHPYTINNIDKLIPVEKNGNDYDAYVKMLESSGLDIVKVFGKEKEKK
jgi:phosphonate transport system substrate-binding protein